MTDEAQSEVALEVPEAVELEDWNTYAETMQRRALARLLGIALREVVDGKMLLGLQLLKAASTALTGGGLGKQEFVIPLQRYFNVTAAEVRQELEMLRTERTIEQLVEPLTGRR